MEETTETTADKTRRPLLDDARTTVCLRRGPGRPSQEQSATLRNNILRAALKSFIEKGFEATSIEGIARRAGVAKITLYRQFETKERLFVAVARQSQLEVRNTLIGLIDINQPLDQVLRTIIARLHAKHSDPDYLAVSRMVIAEVHRFPALGSAMLTDSEDTSKPLVQYLQNLKDMGRIQIPSARDAANQIVELSSGAGRYLFLAPRDQRTDPSRWIESLVLLFTRAWQYECQ